MTQRRTPQISPRKQPQQARSSGLVAAILQDVSQSPLERLRTLVHDFLQSECDEATVRVALADAAPLYRHAPEARESNRALRSFMREALPKSAAETREVAGELIFTTLSAVGKSSSETPRSSAQIKAYAGAMTDMFCAYLSALKRG